MYKRQQLITKNSKKILGITDVVPSIFLFYKGLLNPLSHLVASEEVVNCQANPAADKYQYNKHNLLEGVAIEVPNLQSSLDSKNKTNEPNNS